ncbi:hypothetical protein PV08_09633 [Exophiala spinifera]|uniref:Transcription factor domain-containing protein n=1 Tax=Exophiala spinifera TaxID=91928 RepID=A0A0D1YBN3_9EURO|nr:uncharacterized protein PV08_09633 [Exophiala spinifera]KIW12356.1 hypothetical protein PV08_09633 [Exophiala spinifera]
MIPDGGLTIQDPEFASLGIEPLTWDDSSIDFSFLTSPRNDKTFQYPNPASSPSWLFRQLTREGDGSSEIQRHPMSPNLSIPSAPSFSVRSIVHRPRRKAATQRTASLILHILKSYPLMMMRHGSLPPFIHSGIVSSSADSDDMKALNNCVCLVHMMSAGVPGSRELFWKNVLGPNSTLKATSKHLNRIRKSAPYTYDLEQSWKDWVFEESARRICVVYQVINMLVYFEPAALCELDGDLLIAPLPARKQLWEAGDMLAWKAESEREPGIDIAFGLTTKGDLIRSGQDMTCSINETAVVHKSRYISTLSHSTANWEEWCSGMDGLGGLIMLAASLVGQ